MGFGQSCQNHLQHRRRFLQHLIIPEAQNTKARLAELAITISICRLVFRMLPAIQFDDEPGFKADEVEDKAEDKAIEGMLAAEFNAELAATQALPEQMLGIGGRLPQLLRNSFLA